jgi:hypothetical protein
LQRIHVALRFRVAGRFLYAQMSATESYSNGSSGDSYRFCVYPETP